MNTAKVYQDLEGNDCSIWQMIQREPEWAANRIQEGEKSATRIAELESDARIMAKGLAHIGPYEIDDYQHPDYETNNNRLPCTCPACIIAAKYREG